MQKIALSKLSVISKIDALWATRDKEEGKEDGKTEEDVLVHQIFKTVLRTLNWISKETYDHYSSLQNESSKIAHFRTQFGLWKAVFASISDREWYREDLQINYVKAYLIYIESIGTDLYILLYSRNVFLGYPFSPLEKEALDLKVELLNFKH